MRGYIIGDSTVITVCVDHFSVADLEVGDTVEVTAVEIEPGDCEICD